MPRGRLRRPSAGPHGRVAHGEGDREVCPSAKGDLRKRPDVFGLRRLRGGRSRAGHAMLRLSGGQQGPLHARGSRRQAPFNAKASAYEHKAKGPCPCGKEHAPAEATGRKYKAGTIDRIHKYRDESDSKNRSMRRSASRIRRAFTSDSPWGMAGIRTTSRASNRSSIGSPSLVRKAPAEVVWIVEGEGCSQPHRQVLSAQAVGHLQPDGRPQMEAPLLGCAQRPRRRHHRRQRPAL